MRATAHAVPSARTTFALTATATSLLSTTIAFAGPVPVGATEVTLEGSTSDSPALVGEVIAQKQAAFAIEDFTTGKTLLAGTVEQRVIMETQRQSITFHYLVTGTPSPQGTGELFRFSAFSFGPLVETDVNYLVDDAAIGKPSHVARSENAVDAYFDDTDGTLDDGEAISFYVQTNAATYDETGFVIADALSPVTHPTSGIVRSAVVEGLFRAVVPENPVAIPLPAAVYSGIAGLFTVAWVKRRKK